MSEPQMGGPESHILTYVGHVFIQLHLELETHA